MFLCQTKSIKQQQGQLCIHEKRSNVLTFDITHPLVVVFIIFRHIRILFKVSKLLYIYKCPSVLLYKLFEVCGNSKTIW